MNLTTTMFTNERKPSSGEGSPVSNRAALGPVLIAAVALFAASCAPSRGELVETGFSDGDRTELAMVEVEDDEVRLDTTSPGNSGDNQGNDAGAGAEAGPVDDQSELFAFAAPELYSGIMVSGRELYDDAPIIMSFVVPGCPVCVTEGPKLAAAAIDTPDVNFVVVHSFGEYDEFVGYINSAELATENITHLVDVDGTLWNRFGVASQPSSILVDQGGLVTSFSGALGDDGLLRAISTVTAEV